MAWHQIESDGNWTHKRHKASYMLDSAGDINNPPDENDQLAEGSVAYTADMLNIYQKNASGQWVKVGG